MKTTHAFISALCLLGSAAIANAGTHHKHSPTFTTVPLADNLYMLQGKGGNLALLTGDDGLLMVDNDYKDMSDALKKALKPHGGVKKLNYLINTHWHGDHTGGNHTFGEFATIVAHHNVRKRLATPQKVDLFKMTTEPYPKHALPSVTYSDNLALHVNEEEVYVVHLKDGHTDGDSVVYFTNHNVIHMGDHFFNGFFPFVDVQNGGNVLTMADNLDKVFNFIDPQTTIIPGHGPLAKKQDLRVFQKMLQGTSAEVEAMMKKGMSLEAIQEKGLSEQWKKWGGGFLNEATWISIVHNSLNTAKASPKAKHAHDHHH